MPNRPTADSGDAVMVAAKLSFTSQVIQGPRTLAIHFWDLKAVGSGTLVRTSESFDGWLVRLFPRAFQRVLDKALDGMLRSLKITGEKIGDATNVVG